MTLAIALGAGRGFGLEAARFLGLQGHEVVITDIDPRALEHGQASLEASGCSCRSFLADATDGEQMRAVAEAVGPTGLDFLICVAGGSLGTPRWVEEVSTADVRNVVELCVGSALNAIDVFRNALIKANGAVVFVSSSAARLGDRLGWSPVYAFGKGVMLGMARFIACDPEWASVRSTAVCPGDVKTQRTGEIHSSGILAPDEVEIVLGARNALGRMAEPEEMGYAIASLAMNTFASGTIFDVNGGEYPTPA